MNRKELLIAVILTFITISAWVIFDIIHTRQQVEISPQLKQIIEPVDPQFDLKALEETP